MWLKIEMLGRMGEFKKARKSTDALTALFYDDDYHANADTNIINLPFAFRFMCHLAEQTQFIINDKQDGDLELVQCVFDKMQLIFA